MLLGSSLCDRVAKCNQNKNQQYWIELYFFKVIARNLVFPIMNSKAEKMQISVGVVFLCIQFAAVLVAVQYSISVACIMRRTEWTGRRKVGMYWHNREYQTLSYKSHQKDYDGGFL